MATAKKTSKCVEEVQLTLSMEEAQFIEKLFGCLSSSKYCDVICSIQDSLKKM